MDLLNHFFEILLNLDQYIVEIVNTYQEWTYVILFLIIFSETGLIVAAFLPGDALLFTTGSVAALGGLNVWFIILILIVAAYLGDTLNYKIGALIGKKAFERDYKFINRKQLEKTHVFYEKHGGKTIIFARFLPIIRTFAPFVAGVSGMKYSKFVYYNIVGAILWVFSCTLLGYYFGNIPLIKNNFSLVIVAIVVITTTPVLINYASLLIPKK